MADATVVLSEVKHDWIDDMMKSARERRQIKCPRCFHVNDPEYAAEDGELITLYGTDVCDDPIKVKCARCESMLAVREDVQRTYEVELIEAGEDVETDDADISDAEAHYE